MAIEYLGLNSVNGPFVVLEGVKGAAYDEIVEIVADGKEKKLGREPGLFHRYHHGCTGV